MSGNPQESGLKPAGLTVPDLVARHSRARPDSTVLSCPGRRPLTYDRLYGLIREIADVLQALGVQRTDRVATVMRNGPEVVVAYLGIASVGAFAPLNPSYRYAEFEFYLSDLRAKVLIVERGCNDDAIAAATALGIPVLALDPDLEGETGRFHLATEAVERGASTAVPTPSPEDVALVLHTSGTTSRPKIVPLTHANLCTSAANIAATLELTPDDRCLNVMPLFHIHGLMGVVLSSIHAGGSLACTPRFEPDLFFRWLDDQVPTWYSAVPTIHQAVLAAAPAHTAEVERSRLRFVRSSSASLAPAVMASLEATFGVPAIEAYGMTEASHQMASNPLPPGQRKPGSVGPSAGPEIAIMDDSGALVSPGGVGEIVIKGPSVVREYEANPEANEKAFVDGWFRTGDLGYFDEDGYLFIAGRLKELINRGGEKVSPREVDEVLLKHPDVVQVAAFGVEHPTLGEDVAAAVVVREASSITTQDLRAYAGEHLAGYKVPATIVIVDAIPKGPTGKLRRLDLAKLLADDLAEAVAPQNPTEEALARVWCEVLELPEVSVRSSFQSVGGDSISALRVAALAAHEGLFFSPETLLDSQTIEQLARVVEGASREAAPTAIAEAAGPVSALGLQRELLHRFPRPPAFHHFTTELVLSVRESVAEDVLRKAIDAVVSQHGAFRLRLDPGSRERAGLHLVSDATAVPLSALDLRGLPGAQQSLRLSEEAATLHQSLDLAAGPPARALLCRMGSEDRVVFAVHHLVADRVSCGLLSDQIATAYARFSRGEEPTFPPPSGSVRTYGDRLAQMTEAGEFDADLEYWGAHCGLSVSPLPVDGSGANTAGTTTGILCDFEPEETSAARATAAARGHGLSSFLVAALVHAARGWRGDKHVPLGLLHHGRSLVPGYDVSRTVGCFSYTAPLLFTLDATEPEPAVQEIAEQLARVPHAGAALMLLMGSSKRSTLRQVSGFPRPQILLNWRGVIPTSCAEPNSRRMPPSWRREHMWKTITAPERRRDPYVLHVDAEIWSDRLMTTWYFSTDVLREERVMQWAEDFRASLRWLSG